VQALAHQEKPAQSARGTIKPQQIMRPAEPLYAGQACFMMHRFEDAVRLIKRSIAHNPESLPSYSFLAACHGQLGEDALAAVRRISPEFSIAWLRTIAAYRRAADLDLLTEGLRKAGVPE
jgi:adenylate cyclase